MAREVFKPAGVHPPTGYSHAIKVGNTIYVAGQVAMDEAGNLVGGTDPAAQAEQVYTNLQRVLAAAGANLRDVVKLNTYATDMRNMRAFREVRQKYFGDHAPASTAVQVVALAQPGLLLEVEAVAVVD